MVGSIYDGGSAASELANYRRFLEEITVIDQGKSVEKRLLPG